jgi:hypothetical protein
MVFKVEALAFGWDHSRLELSFLCLSVVVALDFAIQAAIHDPAKLDNTCNGLCERFEKCIPDLTFSLFLVYSIRTAVSSSFNQPRIFGTSSEKRGC